MPVGIALHTLAAVIWVGGMFFAYLVLRPSAGALARNPPAALGARLLALLSLGLAQHRRLARKRFLHDIHGLGWV